MGKTGASITTRVARELVARDPGIRRETATPLVRAILIESNYDGWILKAIDRLKEQLDLIGRAGWPGQYEEAKKSRDDYRSRQKKEIPNGLRKAVFERDAYRCINCGDHHNLSIDHHIPECRGGETIMENLRTLCRRCNASKGHKMPEGC